MPFYSSPQENDAQSSTKSMAEMYARRTALSMTSTIVKTLSSLLVAAQDSSVSGGARAVLDSAPAVARLMPHVFASAANLALRDPHAAVQVLSFVQELLPSVAVLNNLSRSLGSPADDVDDVDEDDIVDDGDRMDEDDDEELPSPHYAWVESDHPYK